MSEEGTVEEIRPVETPVEAEGASEPETSPARRRRPLWRRVARGVRWGLATLALLTLLFFTQTSRGQQIVVDEVLERVRGLLAGELIVEDMRSRSLLLGLTLQGVRLDAEGGRRFLHADSVVFRYSPWSLVVGSPRISSATFHGLHVEISRYPGDDFTNVNRLVPRGDTTSSRPSTIGLGRIAVRGGTLEILTPTTDAPEELSVPAPDEGRLRRMAFDSLDLDLERTLLRTEGPVMLDARLASLSASVFVLEEPLVIHEAQGDLTFGDRGLRIEGAAFRLPGSFLEGDLGFGPARPDDPWSLRAAFRSNDWSDLSDIGWVDARIPDGRFRGRAELRVDDGIQLDMADVDLQTGGSDLGLDGVARFDDAMSVSGLRVTATPLELATLEPWLEQELPFRGTLEGTATLGGTLADLAATGRMTFTPDALPEASTTADFTGTIHSGANPGGTSLEVRLDPFDYRVLEPVWPQAMRLGTGRATVFVEGRANAGMLLVADVTHRSDSTTTSRAVGRGIVRHVAGSEWDLDVRAELAPLSLPLLGRLWPQIDLPGTVRGPVRADGGLSNLRFEGDLTSESGRVVFEATADMTAPGAGYVVEADAEELDLSAFASGMPTPSVVSGHVSLDGSGVVLDSLSGSAAVALRTARIGALVIDSADVALHVDDGLLTADTLSGSVGGVRVNGSGSVGTRAERSGEARFAFAAETLLGLRPVFMGDSILVADTLTPLEQDALRARDIEPDTLPTSLDVRLEGVLDGTAQVRGWFGDLDLDLLFDLTRAAYGHNSVDSARVSLMASGLPETRGEWDVEADARGIVWLDREFQEIGFDGTMFQRRGEGVLDVVRRPNESYYLTGAFALDSLGGELQLTDAVIEVNDLSWTLTRPTTVAWNETSVAVDSLEVRRVDEDPMLLTAAGTLTRGGDSDFRLVMEGFHVEQALSVAQREDIDLAGHVDLDLDIVGPAERPVINARFDVEDPRYGSFQLARLDGSLAYRDRSADVLVNAWTDERRVLAGEGTVPVDLALAEVEGRAVEEPMDLTVRADELDASLALGYLSALEDVVGTVSAEISIRGTPSRPEPSGEVTLNDAAWTVDALGVRHTGVSGEIILQPDRTVKIQVATLGSDVELGASTVSGTVSLEPVTDPVLDLEIGFDRFLAVDRRDMQGRLSGEVRLTGTYRRPVTQGALTVDEATLFVDEFARNAGVVDLRSPLMYTPDMAVDTAVFVTQPLIGELSNPFLDNMRVDVDLAVPRNVWLRSDEMNVEMGGELNMRYGRAEGDLVFVGELQALRGSYVVLARTFEVDGGTTSFLGRPGINPSLDIQALSRVRRRDGDRLEVRATVGGTLVEPIVTLSTEEAGVSQSDLISYLVFGQSSAEVGGQALGTAGLTYVTGTLANQLGTSIAQEIPLINTLDYLSFSQQAALGGQDLGGVRSGAGTVLGGTQVELGKYLTDDVFVIFVLGSDDGRADSDSGASIKLRGVRIELALDQLVENVFLEAFMEDQFLRSGSGINPDLDGDEIVGFLLFGEWGFGARQQEQ